MFHLIRHQFIVSIFMCPTFVPKNRIQWEVLKVKKFLPLNLTISITRLKFHQKKKKSRWAMKNGAHKCQEQFVLYELG